VASGGWPGLSGCHGRRAARRNRSVAQRNRASPARDRARKGWIRRIGSPPVRGHRQNFTKALRAAGRPPEGGSASVEARGGGVHDGIGVLPDRIGLCPLATVPPPWPALASTVTSRQSPIPSCTPPPMASREAGPRSRGHRQPPGGSESLRKILTMPPHERRASSTVPALAGTVTGGQGPIPSGNAPIPSCTPPPLASREAGPPSGGHRRLEEPS